MIEKVLYKNRHKINGFIQVGANIGQELHILNKYSKNIYLFEPLKDAIEILERKVVGNKNIKLYKFALGQKNEIKK